MDIYSSSQSGRRLMVYIFTYIFISRSGRNRSLQGRVASRSGRNRSLQGVTDKEAEATMEDGTWIKRWRWTVGWCMFYCYLLCRWGERVCASLVVEPIHHDALDGISDFVGTLCAIDCLKIVRH